MKKIFLAALSACMLTACESYTIEQVPNKVHVAFNMSTNDRMQTRSVLTANGAAMVKRNAALLEKLGLK